MRISIAFDNYKNNFMILKNRSSSLIHQCEAHKKSLIAIVGDIEIGELTITDVRKWFNHLRKTRCINTVRNYIGSLRSVLHYCELTGIPCLKRELIPSPKREERIPHFLTPEEISQLIANAYDVRAKFIISLLYASGIRLSELLSLDRGQIRDKKFSVRGKGGKVRLCFIDDRTEKLMNQYLTTRNDNCEALIVSKLYKQRMTESNIQLIVKNAAEKAGLSDRHITPHTLRHSFATNLLTNGVDIRYIANFLGHSSVSTTMKYTHVTDPDLLSKYNTGHTC